MLTLINTNRMFPAIGPIGLDYIAGAAKKAGIAIDIVDLPNQLPTSTKWPLSVLSTISE